jgi:hypothetical protein
MNTLHGFGSPLRYAARLWPAVAVVFLLSSTASAQTGGGYDLTWHTIDGGGGLCTGGNFELRGTIGQPDAGDLAGGGFTVAGGFWAALTTGGGACVTDAAECADLDADNTRDDNCVWWECAAGICVDTTLIQFADMGGAFGVCPPDTFANIHDRNHSLSCFAGTNPCDPINIDAGGAFGACPPDGFCNIHDANHALSAFAGTNTCSCPAGPMPELEPLIVDMVDLRLVAGDREAHAGDEVQVRLFIDGPVADLRSYQLDVQPSGGKSGQLVLLDIAIEARRDHVFAGEPGTFDAFNPTTGQMLSGLDEDAGVSRRTGGYLATYTYAVSKDAAGPFVIDAVHGGAGQSFLVAPQDGMIEIDTTSPAVITVSGPATRR